MTKTMEAVYDGRVFQPDGPIELKPNTRVRITIETSDSLVAKKQASFLKTAKSLNLQGPPDWAARLDDYLYQKETSLNG